MTPLMHAVGKGEGNKKNIETLIRCSQKEELNEGDNEGCTVLHHVRRIKTVDKAFLKSMTLVSLNHLDMKLYFSYSSCSFVVPTQYV